MDGSRLVYSTEKGRMCPDCSKPIDECRCGKKKKPAKAAVSPADGVVRISREAKGRNGKTVTIITGIPLDDEALHRFAADLKKRCGSGGTVRDTGIVIQGDHREMLLQEMKKKGFPAKLTGG